MNDIMVIVMAAIAVALGFDSMRLARRIETLKRQLEEEQAYNEHADAKVGELGASNMRMSEQLANLHQEQQRMQYRYRELVRERLAENYVIVHKNVQKRQINGN